MFLAYWSLSPWAPVLFILSLPAKSTKFNLEAIYFLVYYGTDKSALSRYNIKSKCDLDESLFMAVSPTDRFLFPKFMYSINYSCVFAGLEDKSLIKTPFSGLSLIYRLFLMSLPRRSLTSSL